MCRFWWLSSPDGNGSHCGGPGLGYLSCGPPEEDYDLSLCLTPGAGCPNGMCDAGENCINCLEDCGYPVSCGNGTCEPECEENAGNCPQDCQPVCGDGICSTPENCNTCPPDCDAVCPNGVCEDQGTCGENAASCPQDCQPFCGDNICSTPENCNTCPQDCDAVCPKRRVRGPGILWRERWQLSRGLSGAEGL